jgi:hypothetical protein
MRAFSLGARHSSGASFHVQADSVRLARLLSGQDSRGPEDHDAPLEWRAPSGKNL